MSDLLERKELEGMSVSDKIDRILVQMEKLDPIIDAYDSVMLGKKFLLGLGTLISSIIAVGALALWIIRFLNIKT